MATTLRETTQWLRERAAQWTPASPRGRIAALAAAGAVAFALFALLGNATAGQEERLDGAVPLERTGARATIAQLNGVVAIPARKPVGRSTRRAAAGGKPVTIVGEG